MPDLITAGRYTGILTPLGYFVALWDDKNQTLHDKIAGTVVVNA